MRNSEIWIWLPESAYPDRQTTYINTVRTPREREGFLFTAAEFVRTYNFGRKIRSVSLRVGGDTAFRLYLGGGACALYGPASVTGDFLSRASECLPALSTLYEISAQTEPALAEEFAAGTLRLRAEVRMGPEREYELSAGHGGFCLSGKVVFEDGTFAFVTAGPDWQTRLLGAYAAPGKYDGTAADGPFMAAAVVPNRWRSEDSPIPPCCVSKTVPAGLGQDGVLTVAPGQTVDLAPEFDSVIAGYVRAECRFDGGEGELSLRISCAEDEETGSGEDCLFVRDADFQSFGLHSAAKLRIHAENRGTGTAEVKICLMASSYPVTERAETVTSDGELNAVLRACENNLRWCRQTLHLDSARHCEPLACTGDYYIETLMTAFSFGDLRLSALDVRRTAASLCYRNGRMFHTSYSLIWVQMLYDVYRYTGEEQLLRDCLPALTVLLDRFHGYLGQNGLIETPPDFMFVDWLNPDGISLHHPPKALGQTCLCMFYFGALNTAAAIYRILGEEAMAARCRARARDLKECVFNNLWDPQRELFFEGLNTPTPEHLLYRYMPQNTQKRYYRRHANILAACFGFFDRADCAALLDRIADDDSLGEVQPYFMHFWLEAVYRNGLREKYTRKLLDLWKPSVREFPKGIAEGFYRPEPTYRFDHSHAWGGTPLYSLPLALCGLEILEPGFGSIRLSPSLLGLEEARVEIPTPAGQILLEMKRGEPARVTLPEGVELKNPGKDMCVSWFNKS